MKTEAELRERNNLRRVRYDPRTGYPGGTDLYFKCPMCETYMPSSPRDYDEARCRCGYLFIDIDMGRLSVGAFAERRVEPELLQLVLKAASS